MSRWEIVVRVFRKWNIYPKTRPNELFAISMILIDEEGNKVQASVINKSLHKRFREEAKVGKTYLMANFVVSSNKSKFRATPHDYKITFTPYTHMEERKAKIPEYSYSFMSIPEILRITEPEQLDHLFDVLAYVSSIGNLDEYRRDEENKNKLRMVLTDNDDNDVECILWDECSSDAYSEYLDNYLDNSATPVVILLNLARISFTEDGLPVVSNSYNATKVTFNPTIKEAKDFVRSSKGGHTPICTPMSQAYPSQYSQQSSAPLLKREARIPIDQIVKQKLGEAFVIIGKIKKFESTHGWEYDGCSKCSSKVKECDGVLKCPSCKKKPDAVEPKLKLHYTVVDDSGVALVVFWDKLASQIVDKTADQLLLEKKTTYHIPEALDEPVGKTALIQLKKNKYNMDHPFSGISVLQYTICEDLMDQFKAEGTDNLQSTEGSDVHKDTPDSNISSPAEPTCVDLLDDDDVPLAQLSRPSTSARTKVKKRSVRQPNDFPTTNLGDNSDKGKSVKVKKNIKKEK